MLVIVFGLVIVVAALILYGDFRWKSGTRELRDRLEVARLPIEPQVFDKGELERLPAPVQRYFRAVLLAHVKEFPDYYERLGRMEAEAREE